MHIHTMALTCILSASFILISCGDDSSHVQISFNNHLVPIFNQHCLECHVPGGAGTIKSGLDLSTYKGLMKGTTFGPIVKAGDSLSSTLNILVEGRADKSINMPHGDRPPLSENEIQKIRQWVNQGAKNN